MAKPELGSKRQCESCGTKFFDLNRNPVVCPKCGATFAAPASARPAARAPEPDEEAEPDPAGAELVPLEDADGGDDKAVPTGDDVEIDDDEAADDTFLEDDEEEGDDVSDLIDGDIDEDEDS